VRALLRYLLERHDLVLASERAPRWYHWPNCRPLGGLPLRFVPR